MGLWKLISIAFFSGFACLFVGMLCYMALQLSVSVKHGVLGIYTAKMLLKFNTVMEEVDQKEQSTSLGKLANKLVMCGTFVMIAVGMAAGVAWLLQM